MKIDRKRWRGAVLTTLACVFALCLALVGCGGSAADPEEPFVGYWEFSEGKVDGEDVGEMLDQLSELMGVETHFIIHLEAGGTGEVDMFGEVEDITWDAEASTITYDGATEEISIDDDGQLRIEEGDDYFLLTKSDEDLSDTIEADKEAYEGALVGTEEEVDEVVDEVEGTSDDTDTGDDSDTSEAGTSAAIDPAIVVADDDIVNITITEKAVDDWGDPGYTVEVTNKSDRKIEVWIPADVTAVNGTMVELYGSVTLLADTNASKFFWFDADDGVVTGMEDLANVQTTFEVVDDDTYDTLATYEVTIP